MARESFANFATTAVSTSTITSSSTVFFVTSGTGSSFPTSNFLVVIDTELIFVSFRSTDTFYVGTRGYDGTTVTSHAIGATVQMSVTAYNLNHLWQNVADTYNADVPPIQSILSSTGVPTGSSSNYDVEFDGSTGWSLYPTSPPSGAIFTVNSTLRNNLLFSRGPNDTNLYTAYVNCSAISGAFTATCKVSDGINVPLNGSQSTQVSFFISDQGNPVSSADGGNRFRIDIVTTATAVSNVISSTRIVRAARDTSGSFSQVSPSLVISPAMPVYLRLATDGSNSWRAFVGDGMTYNYLALLNGFSLTPTTLGLNFQSGNTSGNFVGHFAAVDYVRVNVGSVLGAYGA